VACPPYLIGNETALQLHPVLAGGRQGGEAGAVDAANKAGTTRA
jgi:hypothetical protein